MKQQITHNMLQLKNYEDVFKIVYIKQFGVKGLKHNL